MSESHTSVEIQHLAAVVHHVIAKTDPGKLGYVKLNRILWYADLEYCRWHGASMTGLRHYTRKLQGPMSQEITQAVGRLVKEGKVAERIDTATGYNRRQLISLAAPELATLTAEQISILDQTIALVAPLTANQLSKITRGDPLWKEIENNQAMSVATGSVISRPPTLSTAGAPLYRRGTGAD
jgi:Protein of unknown function (DUF4065)